MKEKLCPVRKNCWDYGDCDDCEHHKALAKQQRKIQRLEKTLETAYEKILSLQAPFTATEDWPKCGRLTDKYWLLAKLGNLDPMAGNDPADYMVFAVKGETISAYLHDMELNDLGIERWLDASTSSDTADLYEFGLLCCDGSIPFEYFDAVAPKLTILDIGEPEATEALFAFLTQSLVALGFGDAAGALQQLICTETEKQ